MSSEPIASAAPSITSTQKAAVHFSQNTSLAILCPAQGYPVPVTRCVIKLSSILQNPQIKLRHEVIKPADLKVVKYS